MEKRQLKGVHTSQEMLYTHHTALSEMLPRVPVCLHITNHGSSCPTSLQDIPSGLVEVAKCVQMILSGCL